MLLKRIDGRTISSYTHGGGDFDKLADDSTYYYTIAAFNKVDVESDLSETISAVTKPRPSKPTGLKGEALKVKEAPLTWLPNPEKDIAVYQIFRGTGSKTDFPGSREWRARPVTKIRNLKTDIHTNIKYERRTKTSC